MDKAPDAFRTISEVAEELDVPQHVLRFWETRFKQIRPMKRGGGRRYYRINDIELLKGIRHLLYGKGYTIKGVQRIIKEQGVGHVADIGRGDAGGDGDEAVPVPAPVAAEPAVANGMSEDQPASGPQAAPRVYARPRAAPALDAKKTEDLKLALADLQAAKRLLKGKDSDGDK